MMISLRQIWSLSDRTTIVLIGFESIVLPFLTS
jgi:hypothetical protein